MSFSGPADNFSNLLHRNQAFNPSKIYDVIRFHLNDVYSSSSGEANKLGLAFVRKAIWGKKGFLRRVIGHLDRQCQYSLSKYSQRKRISFECKEILKKRLKEIETFNASNMRAAIKEKKDRSAIARKDKRAQIYIGKGKEYEIVQQENIVAKHNKFLEEYFESIDPKDACPLIKGLEELEWDKDMEQDYLDDDYYCEGGTCHRAKVWLKLGNMSYVQFNILIVVEGHIQRGVYRQKHTSEEESRDVT
ncbi:hypothetical protein Tco_1070608 [Tanacetum coccineum]|uniref:Uncharacterized protein n=1 Tax=Tanacetum coccineum TaxID=301880 RepID=A0ABQ5HM13_9ASTR